jgi:hypothetical protein
MKPGWFAIVLPRSGIGYPLAVEAAERLSYRRWLRQHGQALLGEFTSEAKAAHAVRLWTARRSYNDNHHRQRPIRLPYHTTFNSTTKHHDITRPTNMQ